MPDTGYGEENSSGMSPYFYYLLHVGGFFIVVTDVDLPQEREVKDLRPRSTPVSTQRPVFYDIVSRTKLDQRVPFLRKRTYGGKVDLNFVPLVSNRWTGVKEGVEEGPNPLDHHLRYRIVSLGNRNGVVFGDVVSFFSKH